MTPEERARQAVLTHFAQLSENSRSLGLVIAQAIREAIEEEREACATIADERECFGVSRQIRERGD